MGNHRFKLSDMMPNAWFYKLRDMSKSNNQNPKRKLPPPTQKNPRKSYYHSTESRLIHNSISPKNHFPSCEPPRKSSKKRAKRKTIYMPSPTPDDDFFLDQSWALSESDSFDGGPNYQSMNEEGLSSSKFSSSATDIIIDAISTDRFTGFDMISEPDLNLPPIVTKPTKNKNSSSVGSKKNTGPGARKSVSRSGGGVKVKIRAPKIASKRMENKFQIMGLFYSESFAIVKASIDPERDFRDSMLEMIVENNIRASKDLEDLLACYLSLNSNHYHGLIIKAFEQIWFNMPEPHF